MDETLNNAKKAQLEAVKMNLDEQLVFDVEYYGAIYQADPKSYSAMLSSISHDVLPDGFFWVDKENNKNYLTMKQLKELAFMVGEKRFRVFEALQIRKDKIKQATSVDELFE